MGKDLKGKEIGAGIVQQPNGTYFARFVDKFGKRRTKRSKKLQEVKQWLADATYIDQHSELDQATDMLVDAWFDYWIGIKKQTVRPNTVRNYSERYERNIKSVIGNKLLTDVKPIHCQKIFSDMADEHDGSARLEGYSKITNVTTIDRCISKINYDNNIHLKGTDYCLCILR